MEPIVSPDDQWLLKRWKWSMDKDGYFRRVTRVGGKVVNVSLHRVIAGAKPGQVVDHINDIRHDNRRENLRICTHQQNACRRRPSRPSSVGYRGVVRKAGCRTRPFQAKITVNGRTLGLGHYSTPEEAATAYDEAAVEHFGEFARLNFSAPA